MNNCPGIKCDLFTPRVAWYQNDASVTLRIMLQDVDDYFLLVDQDHLRFSTITKDRPYYLCLYMFGAVVPEKCTHRNLHREIRINLPKAHRFISWMRLCLEKRHNPNIVADPDGIEMQERAEKKFVQREWTDWQTYKRENRIVNIPPDSSSSDGTESDDEMVDGLIDEF